MAKLFNVKPGQKMCPRCYQRCLEESGRVEHQKKQENLSESQSSSEYEPQCSAREAIDLTSKPLGISPMKRVSDRDKLTYGKRKIKKIQAAAKNKVLTALELSSSDLSSDDGGKCDKCSDLDRLVQLIKEKM